MKKAKVLSFMTLLVMVGIVFFGVSSVCQAEYPKSPVSLIVAYSPGGATDFQARIVTMMAGLEKYLGQPIVIINKPGAGGQVGWITYTSAPLTFSPISTYTSPSLKVCTDALPRGMLK